MHILSLHPLREDHQNKIREARPDIEIHIAKPTECAPWLPDTDILLAFGQTDLSPILPLASKLKWVQALTAGVDKFVALDVFRESQILLTNVRGIHGIPIAEHVLGMILSFTRKLLTAHDNQSLHKWKGLRGMEEIYGKKAAVIGLGSVGRVIANRLKSMGMTVIGVKQSMSEECDVDELFPHDQLNEILPSVDYVIATVPLTPETENLFSMKTFSLMKPSAFFINVSRGPVVNEADLIEALKSGTIGGAGLDVFCEEPLPSESPLWDAPNLLITPHHAATSPQYMDRAIQIFIDNLKAFPDTQKMINIIDKTRGY